MTEPNYWRTYEFLKWTGLRGLDRPFVVPMKAAPKTKFLSYNPTWEDTGEHWGPTLVARIPFTNRAIGLGVWLNADASALIPVHDTDAEYDAYVAVNGPVDRDVWDAGRAEIAALGLDPNEEMELMQAKGIFL
jgi:hypothetical protein